MKNTLQVLPDAILINGVTRKHQFAPEMVYSNNAAENLYFVKSYKDLDSSFSNCSQDYLRDAIPLNEEMNQPEYTFKLNNYSNKELDSHSDEQFTFDQILSHHEDLVDRGIKQVSSQVEQLQADSIDSNSTNFTLKSISVNWESCKSAYLHVVSDVSYVKELEKQKATNQCMHIMFSSLSHEFRTPLNSFANSLHLIRSITQRIRAVLETLELSASVKRDLERQHTQVDKFLQMGLVSSKILELMVEDIMDFAKIEAGTFSLNPSQFTIESLVSELNDIFTHQCEQKRVDFCIEASAQVLQSVFHSDSDRIRQVLVNLVSNSVKFTHQGRI